MGFFTYIGLILLFILLFIIFTIIKWIERKTGIKIIQK